MPHFFEKVSGETVEFSPENIKHIIGALRMNVGEKLNVCDDGTEYECELVDIQKDSAKAKVLCSYKNENEPSVDVTLFQCVPKGDKLETVIQKAVELGVSRVVPVLSSRCVSRPDEKKAKKKTERYNKISLSACEQSGRGKVVDVGDQISFANAVKELEQFDCTILFYEGGGESLKSIVNSQKSFAIFIGPEGGFSSEEVKTLIENGAKVATLGKRILRTETAPLAALSAIMLLTDNM